MGQYTSQAEYDIDNEEDVWAPDEYGFSDGGFLGEDTWEDQKGMEELKKNLKIPNEWFLLKIVNFNAKKLIEIDGWLKENCKGDYRRVGFRSGCSTKVGAAFKTKDDAIFFTLRWR